MAINALSPLNQIVQSDRIKGVEVKAYQEKSFLHSETELSLSEAAQRIARGEKVALEEVHKESATIHWSEQWIWQHHPTEKEARITITQRERTHLDNAQSLEQFARLRSGAAAQTPVEQLAQRLTPYESSLQGETMLGISPVKSGWLGGRKLVDGPGLSAFDAAQALSQGTTVAFTRMPVNAAAEALISGDASLMRERMQVQYLSHPSDLDTLK